MSTPAWHRFADVPLPGETTIEILDADSLFVASAKPEYSRLIAVAPELLETLELLHRIALQTPALNNPDDREVIDMAWAALQKARGPR